MQRFNKIELKKIEDNLRNLEQELGSSQLEESKEEREEEKRPSTRRKLSDLAIDPVRMMEMNMANISAIQPKSPM